MSFKKQSCISYIYTIYEGKKWQRKENRENKRRGKRRWIKKKKKREKREQEALAHGKEHREKKRRGKRRWRKMKKKRKKREEAPLKIFSRALRNNRNRGREEAWGREIGIRRKWWRDWWQLKRTSVLSKGITSKWGLQVDGSWRGHLAQARG